MRRVDKIKDIDGKLIEIGHILAVRYAWNSYVGFVTITGLYVGGRTHQLNNKATYQILGHEQESHKDYNELILNWANEYILDVEVVECPIKIRIYENVEQ